jgi:SPOR domain
MRKIIVPVLAFLLGISVALVVYESVLTQRSPASREAGRSGTMGPSPSPGEPNALREPHAKAAQLLQSGHLREAQDVFLEILSLNPRDEAALHGLAVVRRYMAGDNPATLRRQAEAYWEAIRRGVENEEHYSLRAMETLLTATLQAVQEIEAHKPATHAVAGPTQAATPPAAAQPQDAVPPNGKPPFPPAPAPGSAGPLTPAFPGGKASTTAAPPANPVARQVGALPGLKTTTPAAPPGKPAVPQTPSPSAAKALTPAASPAKPAVPQTPGPSAAKVRAPAAPAAKPAAPQTAIPSSAPATREPERRLGAPAPQTPPAAAVAPPQSSRPAASGGKTTPPPASSSQTWAITAAQAPPAPAEAPGSVNNRLYMVRVGPVSDRDLASAIAKQLSAGGFPQTSVTSRPGFRVVSEPLPPSVAEGLAASLASRGFHTQVEPLGRDVVHVVFGSFASQKDAEALSQRIAAQGYDAWVREEPVYTLHLGPYPQSSVDAISGIVKSNAPGTAVNADPMP